MDVCDHAELHSGQSRYAAEDARLRYVVVCDRCGAELRVLHAIDYRPEPRLDALPPRPA